MKYVVTYTKPNNIIRTGEMTETYTSKSQVNAFVKQARQYPGSYSIQHVAKVNAKGEVTYLPF